MKFFALLIAFLEVGIDRVDCAGIPIRASQEWVFADSKKGKKAAMNPFFMALLYCFYQILLPSFALAGAIQKGNEWPSRTITVCWIIHQDSQQYLVSRTLDLFRDAVQSEYGRAGISFVGWHSCSSSGGGSRISIEFVQRLEGESPLTMGLAQIGVQGASEEPNLQLSEQLGYLEALKYGRTPDSSDKSLAINTLIHELGHSLGMIHEEDRQFDNEDEFFAFPRGERDLRSIMGVKNQHGGLSSDDIRTLKAAYGGSR